jgi:hypothetical protein
MDPTQKEEVPDNSGIISTLKGATNYLTRMINALFGAGAQATQMAADHAVKVKSTLDPVVGEVRKTAEQVEALTLIGSILDRSDRSGIRTVYEKAAKVKGRARDYEEKGSNDLNVRIESLRMTPKSLMAEILAQGLAPRVKAQFPLPDRNSSGKKKKKKSAKGRGGYKPPVKTTRRRK